MNWKAYLWYVVPFCLGLLIGGGLSKNKVVWVILIFYLVFSLFSNFLFSWIMRVKGSVDKKQELKDISGELVGGSVGYIATGHNIGFSLFDRFFPVISSSIGIGMVVISFYLLYLKSWFFAYLSFFMILIYILLMNIYRNTKGGIENV